VLVLLTLAIMGGVVYAFWLEGLLTCCTILVNVLLACLVAFNFFEPLARELESLLPFLAGYEDCVSLVLIFCVTLGVLRLVTNNLAPTEPEYPPALYRAGGVLLGLATGYLVAGFLVVLYYTLPWPQKHDSGRIEPRQGLQRLLPPDRVLLAMMHRAGSGPFNWEPGKTFDRHGNFLLRYLRYKRVDDQDKPRPDDGLLPVK
jgi:hypothetical protein